MNGGLWKARRAPEVVAEREQIRLAHELGQLQLVHDRRKALGITQVALGERLGMSADDVEAVELGGMLPLTANLLLRLSTALDVAVDLHVVAEGHNRVIRVALTHRPVKARADSTPVLLAEQFGH